MMTRMPTPTAAQLSEVIAQVAAPAFMLGAVAAFILVLNERLNRVIDRSQELNAISDDEARTYLKADVPRLKRRAALLNGSIFFSVLSAIGTSLLVIVAFISAFLQVTHETWGCSAFYRLARALRRIFGISGA
jgi:hypothetical protein